jgi:hypothetical protein
MQVLVRVHTRQRASLAYDAQIPAIKLIHEMQNCRDHTRGIAECFRSPRRPKTKTPHSSRAGEESRRVRIISTMLSHFFHCFHGISRNTRLAVLIGAAGWRVNRFRSPRDNLIRRDLRCPQFWPRNLRDFADLSGTAVGCRLERRAVANPHSLWHDPFLSAATNRMLFEKWRLP